MQDVKAMDVNTGKDYDIELETAILFTDSNGLHSCRMFHRSNLMTDFKEEWSNRSYF
jgi:hypothetical protein